MKSNLMQGERVLHEGELHWVVMAGPIALVVMGMASFVVAAAVPKGSDALAIFIGIGCTGFGVFGLFKAWIVCISTELAVTNRRVIAKFGFISRQTYEISLKKVEGAQVEQNLLGRLLDYGTIIVTGTGGGESPIPKVADPTAFRRAVAEAIEKIGEKELILEQAA